MVKVTPHWSHDIPFVGGYFKGRAHRSAVADHLNTLRETHAEKLIQAQEEAYARAVEREAKQSAGRMEKQFAKDLSRASKAELGFMEKLGQRGFRESLKSAGKKAGIAALAVAGVTALGVAASNMRKSRSKLPPRDNSDLDAIAASIPDALPAGPADGRAPDEWQSRVRPGAQPARGPVNPAMNVGPDVQDLGAPPSRA